MTRGTIVRLALTLSSGTAIFAADWNQHTSAQLAAKYLDGRQKEWSEWKNAQALGGTCFSCHTNMAYMFARPLLRKSLGETQPTAFETALLGGLRTRLQNPDPKKASAPGTSVDAVMAALFLNEPAAFDRMWELQKREGPLEGAWNWFNLQIDPWEMPESPYFGATLALMAVGNAPATYREQPQVRERVTALVAYLKRLQGEQTLHNRLMLLWAAKNVPGVLSKEGRQAILDECKRAQQPDGGWTLASLGPFKPHEDAPPQPGSNAYMTGFATFVLQDAGVPRSNKTVARALDWLREHQDHESGFWQAESMNKRYEPGSMQSGFMRDAATSFAMLALLARE